MPGVTKDGKPAESYGYDIGGKVESIDADERGEKMPPSGSLGRLHPLNTDRFITKKDSSDDQKQMGKTGYESKAFNEYGCVKANKTSEPTFLEKDGTWAPADGRGSKS